LRNVRFRPLLANAQIGARCSANAESGFTGDGDFQGSANLTLARLEQHLTRETTQTSPRPST
jgi:hypothetical protein